MRGAVLLVLLLVAPLAQGSHMQAYTRTPDHDDLGRSDEPDFAATSVLGLPLANRVLEPTLDDAASALPDTAFASPRKLAPGCSDDSGRQPSGLCWLNLNVRFLGVRGMSGSAAPGFTGSKATPIRFLDMRQDLQLTVPVTRVFDVHHKPGDTGVRAALQSLDPSLGSPFVAGPTSVWAWFGTWADKNGNGVVDHEQDPGEPGTVSPRNEFVWLGGCLTAGQAPTGDTVRCHPLPRSRMAGWVWPGNHHATCGGGTLAGVDPVVGCSYVAADLPALQAYCLVALGLLEQFPHAVADLVIEGVAVHHCGSNPESLDQDAQHLYGDPLLEDPSPVTPDFFFTDRSGEPDVEARQWVAGQTYPMWFYDQSLLGNTVFVAAEGAPFDDSRRRVDVARARYLDIDRFETWSPLAGDLLQAQVKPTARLLWLQHREQAVATFNTGSTVARGKALDATPLAGPAYASALDPGHSHEPNDARDRYPGAVFAAFGPATHEGFTNSYAGHRLGFRGWLDAQPLRLLTDNTAWQLPEPSGDVLSQCLTCTAGPGLGSSTSVLSGPRAPGDHRRGLDPGLWTWVGHAGLWRDLPQRWLEESLQPDLTFLFEFRAAPPDGWVGNVVNATGAYRYRGFTPQDCVVQGQPGPHEHAWCHPLQDGALADANDYVNHGQEWRGQCISNQAVATVDLAPDGGLWSVPTFVLRAFDTAIPGDPRNVEDWTGRVDNPATPANEATLRLRLACADVLAGDFHAADLLLLPLGNRQMPLTASADGRFELLGGGTDLVRDVDALAGWG